MRKVVLSIGVPGSGKTTFLKKFANENSFVYICLDDIREELCGDAKDQSRNQEVWDLGLLRIIEAIEGNNSVVFD